MSDDRLELIRSRFRSAEKITPAEGQPLPNVEGRAEGPDPAPRDDDDFDTRSHRVEDAPPNVTARLPLNDVGAGYRFVTYFGRDVIRVSRVGWYVWDNSRWRKEDEDNKGISPRVRGMAHRLPRLMEAEVLHIPTSERDLTLIRRLDDLAARRKELEAMSDRDGAADAELATIRDEMNQAHEAKERRQKRRDQYRTFAKSCGNSAKISAFLTEASVSMTHSIDDLDAQALEVNASNGTLAFSRVREDGMGTSAMVCLRDHARRDLITKQMRARFDNTATSPMFDAFLKRVQPDPEIREFLQRWFGLNLTSITGDQKLAFFYGQGANGKSVLTDLMSWIMGDYAATAKIESLTGEKRRGGGDATPDLVPLMGARMVRASEPEQGTRLQEGVIKELTGGENMLVRALHSDFVEVKPQFKLTISGNHKPDIRNTDDGIWRRILLIPFDVQIPEAERDPDLGKKLRAEAPGILNWMVAGLIDYLEGGLQVPQIVADATKEYREDSDPVGSFLAAACEVTGDGSDFTRSSTISAAFTWWMTESGESPWTPTTIQKRMKARAKSYRDPRTGQTFSSGKRSVAGYVGIKIADIFASKWKDAEPNAPVERPYSAASSDSF